MSELAGYKALVVDDDPDLREVIADDLQLAGAQVVCAASGTEALALLQQQSVHFIISDLKMPKGDGRFLAREVQKIKGDKPIFFLFSGYCDISPAEAATLQIAQVFPKPFDFADMLKSTLLHLK